MEEGADMITDSHCHLTCDELADNADALVADAIEAGVDAMLVMCTNKTEYEKALALKARWPENIKVAMGWFCGDAKDVTQDDLVWLEQEALSGRMDLLGEIGLDYYWDTSFKDEQKELFAAQLDIAAKAGLPVSIHMRDASRDTLDILWKHARTPIIFHCFSGSLPIMQEALKMNSFISFAGPVTYKNNKQGPVNVKACPPERMLTETDSPYLAPVPHRGKRNQPAYTADTLHAIAQMKEMDEQDLARQIRSNYLSLFPEKQA